jgi:4,4'-diaponeurosporenoate glycosyltransferase
MVWFLALASAAWLLGFLFFWHVPKCRRQKKIDLYPRTSVIIPARDEERNLNVLLPSLAEQSLQPDEIVVVDDNSQDGTSVVAKKFGTRVIRSLPLPEGWLGKSWACQQGADHSKGEVLIFMDADTFLEKDGFKRILETFLSLPGVLSVSPYNQTKRWHEEFSAFLNLMQMAGTNAFTILGRRAEPAGLFGPFLIISRKDYDLVGGHASVRGKILENYSLGRLLMDAGILLHLYGGKDTLGIRMYPGSFGELVSGWGKSFSSGAGETPPTIMRVIIAWISGMIITTSFTTKTLLMGHYTDALPWVTLYGLYVLQFLWHARRIGTYRLLTGLMFPVFLAFFLILFSWSTFRLVFNKQIKWKGRNIAGH